MCSVWHHNQREGVCGGHVRSLSNVELIAPSNRWRYSCRVGNACMQMLALHPCVSKPVTKVCRASFQAILSPLYMSRPRWSQV